MMAYISRCVLGVFAYDEQGRLIDFVAFPQDSEIVAEKLYLISHGNIVEEEKRLLKKLRVNDVIFDTKKPDFRYEPNNPASQAVRRKFFKLSKLTRHKQPNLFRHEVSLKLLKYTTREATKRDRLIISTVETLDTLEKTANLLSERIREWYSLHFPEADIYIEDHQRFIECASYGNREIAAEKIDIAELKNIAPDSIGIDFDETDIKTIKNFAKLIEQIYSERKKISIYLESLMKGIAPNLNEVAGTALGARLISLTGSLERLARLPASSVQILGAEKALFKHLTKGVPAPKHGVIFQHALMGKIPKKLKGKVARAIAAKISMAAKIDYYSKRFDGESLRKQLEDKIETILEKNRVKTSKKTVAR